MYTKRLALTVVSALFLACTSSPTTGFGTDNQPANASASSSGATSGGGSGGGTESTGGGSSGGDNVILGDPGDASAPLDANVRFSDATPGQLYDTSVPDADVAQTVTLEIAPFTVNAGDEVYMCQQFDNPFNGQTVDIVKMDGQMSVGSHHFFVFNMDPSTGRNKAAAFGPCPGAGIEFHPFPYLSQQPNWIVTYPEPNMGYPLVGTNGLMMNVHYLNTTSEAITAAAKITIYTAVPGTVTTHVGTIFLNNAMMSIAANTPMTSPQWISQTTTPVSISGNYQIFSSWQHMHQYALEFQASINNSVIYDSKQWDEPPLTLHNPYLQVQANTAITWQCNYYNPTNSLMTFGDSAATNIMCIYMAQYFPADATNPDYISPL
jgi:hypothetical protein